MLVNAPAASTPADRPACDEHGYLLDHQAWNSAFAESAARELGLALSPDHWLVIEFLRQYYQSYGHSPAMRVLVKAIAPILGLEHATSRRLYQLFPGGPAAQACKLAGLPKPDSCI